MLGSSGWGSCSRRAIASAIRLRFQRQRRARVMDRSHPASLGPGLRDLPVSDRTIVTRGNPIPFPAAHPLCAAINHMRFPTPRPTAASSPADTRWPSPDIQVAKPLTRRWPATVGVERRSNDSGRLVSSAPCSWAFSLGRCSPAAKWPRAPGLLRFATADQLYVVDVPSPSPVLKGRGAGEIAGT